MQFNSEKNISHLVARVEHLLSKHEGYPVRIQYSPSELQLAMKEIEDAHGRTTLEQLNEQFISKEFNIQRLSLNTQRLYNKFVLNRKNRVMFADPSISQRTHRVTVSTDSYKTHANPKIYTDYTDYLLSAARR